MNRRLLGFGFLIGCLFLLVTNVLPGFAPFPLDEEFSGSMGYGGKQGPRVSVKSKVTRIDKDTDKEKNYRYWYWFQNQSLQTMVLTWEVPTRSSGLENMVWFELKAGEFQEIVVETEEPPVEYRGRLTYMTREPDFLDDWCKEGGITKFPKTRWLSGSCTQPGGIPRNRYPR